MNALIDLFETLSGSVLPWLLLALAGLLAAIFGYLAARGRTAGNGSSTGGNSNMSRNRSATQSDAMSSIFKLRDEWKMDRNYVDTLRNGPSIQGIFTGWFTEERTLCDDFVTAKKSLVDDQGRREMEHPKTQQGYLSIVNESERKPHSLLIYAGLFFLMAVEATGFSLIFADRLSDTASAQAVQQYAIGISIVIAVFALYFADRIGRSVYRQGYAHSAHLHAPNKSLERNVTQALGREDADKDEASAQSLRIINRSDFVNSAAAECRKNNKDIPRFPTKLWIYVAAVVAFGAMVGFVRIGQIDEHYAKEAQKSAAVESSDNASPANGNLTLPPGISQSKAETSDAITQEVLDKEKRGKQLAIGVFVMIFFIAQTLGVVLAAARGFASNFGEDAYKAIVAFREKHGDISFEQWEAVLKSEIDGADRFAQESLNGWQLGLQTAFTNKAMPVPHEVFFKQCASDFSQRTYATYLQLKEHEAQSTTRAIAAMPQFAPQFANAPTIEAPMPPMPQPPIQSTANPTQANMGDVPMAAIRPLASQGTLVEYFVTTASGGEQVERCSLADLKGHILDGQITNLGSLNVRLAGQPDRFMPWAEFAKRGIRA